MKDLPLSLLSRGCGRFVSSNKNTGRHEGRLDVCFTPQDYYIWKSQDSVLRLSSSGRLLVEAESTLPKTYSTRRGPLLLYSQDLVTIETSCDSQTRDRKRRVVRRYNQQVDQQLSTLKELSAAILSYGNTQFTPSRLGPLFLPPLHFPAAPDFHHTSRSSPQKTPEQPSPELLVQFEPRWHPAERRTEPKGNPAEDKEAEQSSRKTVRLDLFLQIPCTSTTPTPQTEPQTWVHYAAMTPEEPEEPQTGSERSLQLSESSTHTEINQDGSGGELHHLNMNGVHDGATEWDCLNLDIGTNSDEGNRVKSGNIHGRTGFLPPLTVGHQVFNGEKTDRPHWNSPSRDEGETWRLPPIADSGTLAPSRAVQVQNQHELQPETDRVQVQSQQSVNRLQPLFLPLLFPAKEEETSGKQRGEKTERQFYKKVTVGPGGGGPIIQLNPGEEPPPPAGVLGCVAGRRGPGRQSSLAFLQNRLSDLQEPCESSDGHRGVVRGVLPLELRDLQNGKSVGSLILGPDGEIIQLSLYDNSQDPSEGDVTVQERALQVLSADGQRLPWVIVLQPEHTHTDGEPSSDVPLGDVQHQEQKLSDVSGAPEACSLTHSARPAVGTSKTKGAETAAKAWKKEDRNSVRMPPLRERGGEEEEERGGNTEAEEEDEEEERGRAEGEKHQSGQQNMNPNEATTEEKNRRNTERRHSEDAATAPARKREMKTVEAAERQKSSRTRREGRGQRTGSDAQPIRSQKQEGRSNRESPESESPDQTAPHAGKKKKKDGERGEVKMKEEREEETRQEEEERRKRRRGRLKHTDLADENPEGRLKTEEQETSQEQDEGSGLNSSRSRSAAQKHKNETKSVPEEDAETQRVSTSRDRLSSVQSVSSLQSRLNHRSSRRSAASSSCEGAAAGAAAGAAGATGLASSRGRLSSCSTVMIPEEQLMLNPLKPESPRPRRSQQEQQEEAAALHRAQRAERRRQEEERKRREQEEKEREQREREQTEERMRSELDGERRRRAEELRLKKLAEEEARRKREEEEEDRARREQAQKERERRRQEERRRQMERLQRMREEEEQRRRAEQERRRLEEEQRLEEENRKLQEMDESERTEYLRRKKQEEEDRRSKEEEQRKREEEAAVQAAEEARLQAELLARQMALLQHQLAFKRSLVWEAGGLEKTQGISRPWIYSYFSLLQLLGLKEAESPDL